MKSAILLVLHQHLPDLTSGVNYFTSLIPLPNSTGGRDNFGTMDLINVIFAYMKVRQSSVSKSAPPITNKHTQARCSVPTLVIFPLFPAFKITSVNTSVVILEQNLH